MAKWADYLVSGVWFHTTANSKYVSHVMLHQDNGDTLTLGEKQSKDYVIQLLKKGYSVLTIR